MTAQTQLEPVFVRLIAQEIGCGPKQVEAAAALFAEGATVPFVARYRKEATGGLEDEQLENLFKRREYFLELAERRDAILASISEQGKLDPELEAKIRAARGKTELEDLYLPYKPKRRTRAQIAREKGLEPLADAILAAATTNAAPEELAGGYLSEEKGVADVAAALAGARDILAERLAENAEVRAALRASFGRDGLLRSRVLAGKEAEGAVYRDYFAHDEPAKSVASHRWLAMERGEREGFLVSELAVDDALETGRVAASWNLPLDTPTGRQIGEASRDGYNRLLRPSIANEVRAELKARAEAEAIAVFRANLEALLMQAPLGKAVVCGLDPGYRTGCKVAVVDATGRVLETAIIHAVLAKSQETEAAATLAKLIRTHGIQAVAIGNGTASRETEAFAKKVTKDQGLEKVIVAIVPETGASVYSASAEARAELPDLDVSLRGAVSIARRLQDPLAELVKIEPKSLGVGQYQHDVEQRSLAKELDTAVETVVNRVGVELNTASISLLKRVSGLSERLARSIVAHRDSHGPFSSRQQLLAVSGLGPKTFEQAAGFLRLRDAAQALDRTAVHPERYGVVEKMAAELGCSLGELVGDPERVGKIEFKRFADEASGLGKFTLEDIRAELARPGRDPRPEFEVPAWRDDVTEIKDLAAGMVLEGRVSNVTNFGAFVDIGVGRDGMVHVSELSHRFIDDPRKAVSVGQIVKVQVKEVDHGRERIALSIKALTEAPASRPPAEAPAKEGGKPSPPRERAGRRPAPPQPAPKPGPTLDDLLAKFGGAKAKGSDAQRR